MSKGASEKGARASSRSLQELSLHQWGGLGMSPGTVPAPMGGPGRVSRNSPCTNGRAWAYLQELPLHQWEGVSHGLLNSLSGKVNSILGLSFLQPLPIENLPGDTGDRQEFS